MTSVPRQAPTRHHLTWVSIPFDRDTLHVNASAAFPDQPALVRYAAEGIWLDMVRARLLRAFPQVAEWLPEQRTAAITDGNPITAVEVALWLEAAARTDLTPQDVAVVAARLGLAEVTA